jgi:hypothetical protein
VAALETRSSQMQSSVQVKRTGAGALSRAQACVGKLTFVGVTSSPRPVAARDRAAAGAAERVLTA